MFEVLCTITAGEEKSILWAWHKNILQASGYPAAHLKIKGRWIIQDECLPSKVQPMGHKGEMIYVALGCFFATQRQLANLGNHLTAFWLTNSGVGEVKLLKNILSY